MQAPSTKRKAGIRKKDILQCDNCLDYLEDIVQKVSQREDHAAG